MLEKQKKAAPEPESSSDSINGGPEGRRERVPHRRYVAHTVGQPGHAAV